MYSAVETKCTELFGECPLNLQDLMAARSFGYSEEDVMFEAAKKHYQNERNAFFNAIHAWKDGNKMSITYEEAKKRNERYKNAQRIVDERVATDMDSLINWQAFPEDDPTIVYYMGLPITDELCEWAQQYKH